MAESLPEFDCVAAAELSRDVAWWRIYEDCFPASERESAAVISRSLEAGVGLAFRATFAKTTVGLATVHLLRQPAAVFLVYLAITRTQRGQRWGSGLFEYAWRIGAQHLRDRGQEPVGLVWEVDRPDLKSEQEEAARCRRRISFFERHGGVVLRLPYVQPPVCDEPVPMHLMFRPPAGAGVPPEPECAALARAMYFEKYGAINGLPPGTLEQLLQAQRPSCHAPDEVVRSEPDLPRTSP